MLIELSSENRLHTLKFMKIGSLLILAALIGAACKSGDPISGDLPPLPADNPNAGESAGEVLDVVASVNNQPIAGTTYVRELARFEAGQAALGMQSSDPATYRQQVLDMLIDQELIRQEAARQGIVVGDETVNAELQDVVNEFGQEYFDGWLAGNLYTPEEFREVVRLELISNQLVDQIITGVPTTVEHVHARHILVNSQAEADAILARIQAGEDFAALAQAHSVDVTSKDNGGDLGWFPRGGLLVAEVEEQAFSLAPGQLSGVITSAWGYHIIQTLEFDPAREIEYDTRQRLINQAIEAWRLSLRNGADIQQFITITS